MVLGIKTAYSSTSVRDEEPTSITAVSNNNNVGAVATAAFVA